LKPSSKTDAAIEKYFKWLIIDISKNGKKLSGTRQKL